MLRRPFGADESDDIRRNLPIGAAAFIIIVLVLRLPASATREKSSTSFREKVSRLDFPGIVLILGSVCCLVLALQWGGQTKPWRSADVIGLLVGAVLLAVAFGVVQWRKGDKATIPFRILRQRTIFMGACYLFFLEMAIFAVRLSLYLFLTTEVLCQTRANLVVTSICFSCRFISSPRKWSMPRRVVFVPFHWVFPRLLL